MIISTKSLIFSWKYASVWLCWTSVQAKIMQYPPCTRVRAVFGIAMAIYLSSLDDSVLDWKYALRIRTSDIANVRKLYSYQIEKRNFLIWTEWNFLIWTEWIHNFHSFISTCTDIKYTYTVLKVIQISIWSID